MARQKESLFVGKIHKLLPSSLHREKNDGMTHNGRADWWYSGAGNDLWIEYKFIDSITHSYTPKLTKLQQKWLRGRYNEGRNVAVVVGTEGGGFVLRSPDVWEMKILYNPAHLLTVKELADWILCECTSVPRQDCVWGQRSI